MPAAMPGNPAQGKEAGWEMTPDQEKADRGSMRLALNAPTAPNPGADQIAEVLGSEKPTRGQNQKEHMEYLRNRNEQGGKGTSRPMKPGERVISPSTGDWNTGI